MSNAYPKKAATAGDVRISENVIRSIAGVAAKEIEGVAELAEGKGTLLMPAPAPVTVSIVNDMVEITVRLVLMNGVRLTTVAEQVQQNIKENVQSMTGVVVSKVHVIASDIAFDD
ncbi:MAG: Asp23/Gls24 family envelope stress response protein [Oscillospiraceae bacterium]|nr:Asp23/Gls24 family envelope stress response protein [Oscillospiraceae bacterium]